MIKTDEEIKYMIEGGKIARLVYKKTLPLIKIGTSTKEIDSKVAELIKKYRAQISFSTVKGYQWASCTCINEQIVHTPPSNRKLIDGDIFTLDFGVLYKGYHVDFADTLLIGSFDPKKTRFLRAGQRALREAIQIAVEGKRIIDISKKIYESITKSGYKVIRGLTGHGIGKDLHEKPLIPGYPENNKDSYITLKRNMTIAIEIIYSETTEMYQQIDEWSLITENKSLSACFEHTVVVGKKPRILT